MGVTAVLDNKYAVVTQAYSSKPCKSATTRGRALATIELSRAARNTHKNRAPRVTKTSRRPISSERKCGEACASAWMAGLRDRSRWPAWAACEVEARAPAG